MKKDIKSYQDIEHLLGLFYAKVRKDSVIGYIFNDVMKIDWESHIPQICRFWESILLGRPTFRGNPMKAHILINQKEKLFDKHFNQWIFLWKETLDKNFSGEKTEMAKERAQMMRQLMLYKIRESEENNFVQ